MRTLLCSFAISLFSSTYLAAMPIDQREAADRETFLNDATAFLKNPLAKDAKERCGRIITYATESEDIEIQVSAQNGVVWLNDQSSAQKSLVPFLLCAYIAGNGRAQIESNIRGNQVLPAIDATLTVYKAMKRAHDDFRLQSLEKLDAAQKAGKLSEHLATLK